jgi:diacylglycerol kinase family enzyme
VRLDTGKLSLVMPRASGRLRLFWFSLRALVGRDRPGHDLDILSAQELLIGAGHRIVQVTLDGEVATMNAPLRYRVRPGALRVMAPMPVQ